MVSSSSCSEVYANTTFALSRAGSCGGTAGSFAGAEGRREGERGGEGREGLYIHILQHDQTSVRRSI